MVAFCSLHCHYKTGDPAEIFGRFMWRPHFFYTVVCASITTKREYLNQPKNCKKTDLQKNRQIDFDNCAIYTLVFVDFKDV